MASRQRGLNRSAPRQRGLNRSASRQHGLNRSLRAAQIEPPLHAQRGSNRRSARMSTAAPRDTQCEYEGGGSRKGEGFVRKCRLRVVLLHELRGAVFSGIRGGFV